MSDLHNHLSIYLIVFCNALCQTMLIRRLKLAPPSRWGYCALAVALPAAVAASMRLMVALGAVHARIAEQAGWERLVTTMASLLLIAGPLLVTGAAVLASRKNSNAMAVS